jgi:hypothetical protein
VANFPGIPGIVVVILDKIGKFQLFISVILEVLYTLSWNSSFLKQKTVLEIQSSSSYMLWNSRQF